MNASEDRQVARRETGLDRVLRKLFQVAARQYLMPSRVRKALYCRMGVRFRHLDSVFIGEGVYFDDAHPELISIGRFVRITAGCRVFTHFFDAKYRGTSEVPYRFFLGSVDIGDYVFVGSNVTIANACRIGDWAVIGANSVIVRDVPEGAIVAGSPARVIGYRVGFGEVGV